MKLYAFFDFRLKFFKFLKKKRLKVREVASFFTRKFPSKSGFQLGNELKTVCYFLLTPSLIGGFCFFFSKKIMKKQHVFDIYYGKFDFFRNFQSWKKCKKKVSFHRHVIQKLKITNGIIFLLLLQWWSKLSKTPIVHHIEKKFKILVRWRILAKKWSNLINFEHFSKKVVPNLPFSPVIIWLKITKFDPKSRFLVW